MKEIKSMIEDSLNPFNKDANPVRLFNMRTGKSCKKITKDFLLNVQFIGNEVRKSFIQECEENPNRFKERIKKAKSTILQQSPRNKKFEGLKEKMIEAALIRDLFGSILCLSRQEKINAAEVLKYQLNTTPSVLLKSGRWFS